MNYENIIRNEPNIINFANDLGLIKIKQKCAWIVKKFSKIYVNILFKNRKS
jgi:hypothetical protein